MKRIGSELVAVRIITANVDQTADLKSAPPVASRTFY